MIPDTNTRKSRPCIDCLFWNFDGYCWIGMDQEHRPVEGCDKLSVGIGDIVCPVFPCEYHILPDEARELVNRFLLATK